jgi:centromere protein I
LEEIENAVGFVKNLDKLELPNQLVAVLADPLLQKLMVLRPSSESDQRIANWLNSALQDVQDGDADEATFFEILDILRDYVVSTKVCFYRVSCKLHTDPAQALPSLLLDFFARFLPLWDGSQHRDSMFAILSYCPLLDFQS